MRPILATMLFGSLAACGGGTDVTVDADEDAPYNCAADTRGETYMIDLDHKGDSGILDFKLHAAVPAPPARLENQWDIEISPMTGASAGEGVAGGHLSVVPYMPDHGHISPEKPVVTDMDKGMYHLDKVFLWMPGVWETTIQATTSAGTDSTVFRFCISS